MKDLIIGRRFGELVVIEVLARWKTEGGNKRMRLRTRCSCGATFDVDKRELRRMARPSCPTCKPGYSRTKHPLYARWAMMNRRCSDPRDQDYKNYGGRGISVCQQWRQVPGDLEASRRAFLQYVADVGAPPFTGATVDRADNDDGYHPGNIRWASRRDQAANRRRPKFGPGNLPRHTSGI